jgi:hypothetical protein
VAALTRKKDGTSFERSLLVKGFRLRKYFLISYEKAAAIITRRSLLDRCGLEVVVC